jgi:polysaccharide biosynthesis/export protein
VFTWRAGVISAALVVAGCAADGPYVWVDSYQAKSSSVAHQAYVIVPGDLLSIRVLNHDVVSTRVRVRSDGRISLPVLNDCDAAGLSPTALRERLAERLRSYIQHPIVSVTLEEARPLTVSVLGEVMRPGVHQLEPDSGVLHGIASAGGLSQYAHKDRIFVIRAEAPGQPPTRIRFDYRILSRAEGKSGAFRLQRGDLLVVE